MSVSLDNVTRIVDGAETIRGVSLTLEAPRDKVQIEFAGTSVVVSRGGTSITVGDAQTMESDLGRVQKLLGEHYASAFHICYGLETVALRYFNVYGPRQDPTSPYSGVLSLFMKHLLARTQPTIFGDGEQSRDFTYVEDVAELVYKASQAPRVAGKMYNAGNGGNFTLNQTWKLLQQIEGVDLPANYGPPRPGDVRASMADTASAVRDLGHAPRFSFEDGLRRTLEWYRAAS